MTDKFEPPPMLDLRQDEPSSISTIVTVHADDRGHVWIRAGSIELTERTWSPGKRGCWTFEVRRHGATDCDHDAAVAFRMVLIGVTFRMAGRGRLWLDGFVAGDDPSLFRVPDPGWDQLANAIECQHVQCKAKYKPHLVVEDDKRIPPPNVKLFERLRGRRVEIVTGAGQ